MDVLSDALRVVRLAGARFFTARFSAPWSAVSPAREGYQRLLHTRADQLTIFHLIVSGGCWAARPPIFCSAYLALAAMRHSALPLFSTAMLFVAMPLTVVTLAVVTVRGLRASRQAV